LFSRIKEILKKISDLNKSVDTYQKDTVIQSLPSLALVNRAKKLIGQGKLNEAESILKEATELPQKDALAYKYLGIVYDCQQKFDLAVEKFQISADLNPNDKEIWRKLGFALLSFGKFERAERAFENADRVQAGNTDNFTGWGMALMKQGKFNAAREKFLKAASVNKYNYSAMFLCSVLEIKLNMLDDAEVKLKFLTTYKPNESNTFEYARLRAMRDDYAGAVNLAEKSLEFNKFMLPAYILLGQLYAHNFEVEKSLGKFVDAEQRNLINENLYLEWGKALIKFGKFDEAKEKLSCAVGIAPKNIDASSNLALCKAINNEDISDIVREISKIEPENPVLKQAKGISAFNANDFETAKKLLREENAINYFYLAKCSDDTKAKEYYENSIRLNPVFTAAYIDYAKFLISKNEYEQAQRKLRKGLKSDENNLTLLNLLFHTGYILVKDNICEYNIKEMISIAEKIEKINREMFEYPDEKAELEKLLTKGKQN